VTSCVLARDRSGHLLLRPASILVLMAVKAGREVRVTRSTSLSCSNPCKLTHSVKRALHLLRRRVSCLVFACFHIDDDSRVSCFVLPVASPVHSQSSLPTCVLSLRAQQSHLSSCLFIVHASSASCVSETERECVRVFVQLAGRTVTHLSCPSSARHNAPSCPCPHSPHSFEACHVRRSASFSVSLTCSPCSLPSAPSPFSLSLSCAHA